MGLRIICYGQEGGNSCWIGVRWGATVLAILFLIHVCCFLHFLFVCLLVSIHMSPHLCECHISINFIIGVQLCICMCV